MIDIAGKLISGLLTVPKRLDEQLAYSSAEQAREAVRELESRRTIAQALSEADRPAAARRHGVA